MNQLETAQTAYQTFCDRIHSVMLSTASKDGTPNASYAPFIMDEAKNVYIFVSGLSKHTQNLQNNPQISILFMEDEADSNNIFARCRLSFNCTVEFMERESADWVEIGDRFEARFGETVQIIRSLADFRLVKLTPQEGRFVLGFGQAYQIQGEDLTQLVHLNPKNS